ncbi:hypothetical protein IAT38_005794 [Cryptococcus sp. DSM 104549]
MDDSQTHSTSPSTPFVPTLPSVSNDGTVQPTGAPSSSSTQQPVEFIPSEFCYFNFAPEMTFDTVLNPSKDEVEEALVLFSDADGSTESLDQAATATAQSICKYLEVFTGVHGEIEGGMKGFGTEHGVLPPKLVTRAQVDAFFHHGASDCLEDDCATLFETDKTAYKSRVNQTVSKYAKNLSQHSQAVNKMLLQSLGANQPSVAGKVRTRLGEGWEERISRLRSSRDTNTGGEQGFYYPFDVVDTATGVSLVGLA